MPRSIASKPLRGRTATAMVSRRTRAPRDERPERGAEPDLRQVSRDRADEDAVEHEEEDAAEPEEQPAREGLEPDPHVVPDVVAEHGEVGIRRAHPEVMVGRLVHIL